jgi:hypothetical protein
MAADYLDWLNEVFDEAQVPHTAETAPYLDKVVREIAGLDSKATDEQVLEVVRRKWLRHGRSGWQLLAGLLRSRVFSRRDSPFRPAEGNGYFTNDQYTP